MAALNRNIDILKYIMSLFIIMIHIGYSHDYPIIRVAVPVFFIISSYLFFSKINKVGEKEWSQILINFIIRAFKLYIFWFIVLLPVTIVERRWYLLDFYGIIEQLIVGVLFKSTFLASWYISAYVIGII